MGLGEIVVVVPTERESLRLRELGVLRAAGGRLEHCGVGMAECAAAVSAIIAERRPRLMILAGITGSYSADLAVGETVVVASEIVADLGRFSSVSEGGFVPLFQHEYASDTRVGGFQSVKSNTVSTAGWTPEAVRGLPPDTAQIENMEGAAFMAVCARSGVPAMEVRTVSNRVGEPISPENLSLAVENLARDLEKILYLCRR